MGKSGDRKVILIGLDGGTFNIINPFIEEGLLPNIASMMNRGTYGILESTIPPVTAPAWASFMTGKNPGKHGVLQFFNFGSDMKNVNVNIYNGNTTNYLSINEPTIFDYLKGTGKRVISINIPMTYPPQEVDGYMISCWLTPPNAYIFTYPPELKDEIPDYRIDQYFGESKFALLPRNKKLYAQDYFADLTDVLEKRGRSALKLLKEKEWDLFMICFTETDRIQHFYWRSINPEYPDYYSEQIKQERIAFKGFYKKLDHIVGDLIKMSGENVVKIIISDHGFGPPPAKRISINYWLKSTGWLVFKQTQYSPQGFRSIVKNILPLSFRKFIANIKSENKGDSFTSVDWSRTVAWSINLHNYFGGIFLNKENTTASAKRKIIEGLIMLKDETTGEKIVKEIWEKQEIYNGNNMEYFPDIIYQLEEHYEAGPEGYHDLNSNSFITTNPYPTGRGNHNRDGIYILNGNVIEEKGCFRKYPIESILPTVLYFLDIAIPTDIDGKIMEEVLNPSYIQSNPPRYFHYKKIKELVKERLSILVDTSHEEQIKNKLKGLGYMG